MLIIYICHNIEVIDIVVLKSSRKCVQFSTCHGHDHYDCSYNSYNYLQVFSFRYYYWILLIKVWLFMFVTKSKSLLLLYWFEVKNYFQFLIVPGHDHYDHVITIMITSNFYFFSNNYHCTSLIRVLIIYICHNIKVIDFIY